MTTSREYIAEWIDARHGVFSAQDVLDAFPDFDKVTVYRTIDTLTQLDAIHAAGHLNGRQLFEKHSHDEAHHHHIVCTSCERSACVPCDFTVPAVPGFSHVHHTVQMTGVCEDCSKKE